MNGAPAPLVTPSFHGAGQITLAPAKTAPHIRLPKACQDTILTHPNRRLRPALLATMLALLRAENDDRQVRGQPFSVNTAELARLSGLSPGTVGKCLKGLSSLGLLHIESGKFTRRENTYRILEPGVPPRRALADVPASIDEIVNYTRNQGLEISAETIRAFWESNEKHQWMIASGKGRPARPCRDWRKLIVGFAKSHHPAATASTHQLLPQHASETTTSSDFVVDDPNGGVYVVGRDEIIWERQFSINDLTSRPGHICWQEKEMDAFRAASLDKITIAQFDEQFGPIHDYYKASLNQLNWCLGWPEGKDYRRTTTLSILENWAGEWGRAKAWENRQAAHKRNNPNLV